MKVAFSGSSGSGKTTLVKFVAEKFNLPHISGSAHDLYTGQDAEDLKVMFNYDIGKGHASVIKNSAINYKFGEINQRILLERRVQLIMNNDRFVTDRSPADNIVYFLNQVAFHPEITDQQSEAFLDTVQKAWGLLDYVIYIKAVQPNGVEDNGSRVSNGLYQKSVDAQFEYWVDYLMENSRVEKPQVLVLDIWDLETRKEMVTDFLEDTI